MDVLVTMRYLIRLLTLSSIAAFSPQNKSNDSKRLSRACNDFRTTSTSLDAYRHTLAVLTLPTTSIQRISNESILSTCMRQTTSKLSIILRCQDGIRPQLSDLRSYVGEIYSLAWDVVLNLNEQVQSSDLLNVLIYPQNLPNTASEGWILNRDDLECICSHDSFIGWVSTESMGHGRAFDTIEGSGMGGLDQFVEAVNDDRVSRGLKKVVALQAENWPDAILTDENVTFMDDGVICRVQSDQANDVGINNGLTGRYRIPSSSLYNSVAVGGTFDGMHYGHRKLLTLAISSVHPTMGRLTIGITTDDMLKQKKFSELIPCLHDRIQGVRNFVDALAPGMKNRVKIVPIVDKYGPPGSAVDSSFYKGKNDYDALVLSHETLETGKLLNYHRVKNLGMSPLKLLCTRRTEAYGMSSTTLRRIKNQNQSRKSF